MSLELRLAIAHIETDRSVVLWQSPHKLLFVCVFPLPLHRLRFICDPPQDFNAKGESTRTTRFHFKKKEFILTHFSTLATLPH